jgi:vacuolar-type H+-ATPase subunit C/Vma6
MRANQRSVFAPWFAINVMLNLKRTELPDRVMVSLAIDGGELLDTRIQPASLPR